LSNEWRFLGGAGKGGDLRDKVRNAKILVVGAGGIGTLSVEKAPDRRGPPCIDS
jgi:hypothetical protein